MLRGGSRPRILPHHYSPLGKGDGQKGEIFMKKTDQNKQLLLEQLRKTPIVQIACEKTGISRMTYYRWKKEDENFSREADEAMGEGNLLINDLAESQLVAAIKDRNMTAIMNWLRHHHPAYTDKLEVTHRNTEK